MIIEFLKPDFTFKNEMGSLYQLVHKGWTQVNVVTSVAQAVRGGHYHKLNRELFYVVSGSFYLEVSKDGKTECYEMEPGNMFVIPPFASHFFEYHQDTVLVAMYDKGVELPGGEKDIIPCTEGN